MAEREQLPIDWVPAGGRWWLVRVVVPAIVAGLAGLVLYLTWFVAGLGARLSLDFLEVGLVVILVVEFFLLYALPSVRRIGLSPKGLVVDVGIRKIGYPWSEVSQVSRTRVDRYRWNQVSSVSRTRITVGSGLSESSFTLSPSQGDRLAKFLGIP